jgi:hypothetical protein
MPAIRSVSCPMKDGAPCPNSGCSQKICLEQIRDQNADLARKAEQGKIEWLAEQKRREQSPEAQLERTRKRREDQRRRVARRGFPDAIDLDI